MVYEIWRAMFIKITWVVIRTCQVKVVLGEVVKKHIDKRVHAIIISERLEVVFVD